MLKRMLLRGWAGSRNNQFILLWNQRVPLEALFGGVTYVPVLFSKGSPLDSDHIAARNLFKHSSAHGVDATSTAQALTQLLADPSIAALLDATEYERLPDRARVAPNAFRLLFSDCVANRSLMPKRFNRAVQDKRVVEKLSLPVIEAAFAGTLLESGLRHLLALPQGQGGTPHDWNVIPPDDRDLWNLLPPAPGEPWSATTIVAFMRAILRRERHLYARAFDFVMRQLPDEGTPG